LAQIPRRLYSSIVAFSTDMWESYVTAVEEFIAAHKDVTAKLVIDRFHVAQQYREDFDELRKQEFKQMKQKLSAELFERDCKGSLWLLRKNHASLTFKERQRLRKLFEYSPKLHKAYTLREELTALFNTPLTQLNAEYRFKRWMKKVERSQLTCYDGFIKTLQKFFLPILNYFIARINSGFVEGLNNKIKVIKRRCYGIRKITSLFQRIWLDLEGFERFVLSTP